MTVYDDMRGFIHAHDHNGRFAVATETTPMYQMVDEADDENERLKLENAKLRELVRRYVEYTSQDRCEGCVVKPSCNDGEVDECWQLTEIRGLAREMGIEVG